MVIDRIDDTFDVAKYNAKAAHPMQSWEWGEARKEMGTHTVRLGEWNGKTLMDVYQFTLHPIPYTPYKIAYLPRSRFPSKAVLSYLETYAKERNIIFIKFEPNEKTGLRSEIRDLRSVVRSQHPLFPDWTQVLDLTPSEDELLANMKSKTRYNIRLAQKKGVTVREESDEHGFETFLNLYFDTCKRQGYFGHTRTFHRILWNHLKGKLSRLLIAYYEEVPIAAYELFSFNGVFYYPYGGTSILHRNVMGANLLMWEAIRLGKKLGAREFDMWGSLPPDHHGNASWEGFTRFKEGYGASFVQMVGSYDLVVNPRLYSFYNTAHKMRGVFLEIKKFFRS